MSLTEYFWPANDKSLPTSGLDFRASEVKQSSHHKSATHCPFLFSILCPVSLAQLLNLPILDPAPDLSPSYHRPTVLFPIPFILFIVRRQNMIDGIRKCRLESHLVINNHNEWLKNVLLIKLLVASGLR